MPKKSLCIDDIFRNLIINNNKIFLNKEYDFELWKCIIPKGTIYFQANRRGGHYESINSYAGKSIIMDEKIAEFSRIS